MFTVAILYTPKRGRPLSLVTLSDRSLLRDAAAVALREAEQTTKFLMATDRMLGAIQAAETAKLRRVLGPLITAEKEHNPSNIS